ncbi:uncharacterized protein LOC132536970 [Erinaceus europaeus]|uniref:Uncharacterized protein LOC132536970 n=1 Tax=Erinaceus europaeus TaxID=9365 RepID=A0ABM3X0T3_ERIEU|nr:uncharacterized protein LOC132536970 [Erinaceus europaeus]
MGKGTVRSPAIASGSRSRICAAPISSGLSAAWVRGLLSVQTAEGRWPGRAGRMAEGGQGQGTDPRRQQIDAAMSPQPRAGPGPLTGCRRPPVPSRPPSCMGNFQGQWESLCPASPVTSCPVGLLCCSSAVEESGPEEENIPVVPRGHIQFSGLGKFQKGRRWQKRQLILYSNVLLISNTKLKSDFRIKYTLTLRDMWVTFYKRKGKKARTSLVLGWRDRIFVVCFHSVTKMEQWYTQLYRYVLSSGISNLFLRLYFIN